MAEGRLADALKVQQRIDSLSRAISHGGFPARIKGALAAMGICQPWTTSPFAPVDDAQLAAIKAGLAGAGLLG